MIDVVDVRMHGREGLTACFLLGDGPCRALIDCGPASSHDTILAGLGERGVRDLDWIVLTHVHLDHAGGAGRLARKFPAAKVAVHESGARHLADPSRLWEAVRGLYGAEADTVWGEPDPVDATRIETFGGGETLDTVAGELAAIATPGHARHHLSWLAEDSQSLIAGDAAGMHQAIGDLWRPTTPPAAFDRDQALQSIDAMRRLRPEQLLVSHFGVVATGVERCREALDAGAASLSAWCAVIEAAWERGMRDATLEAHVGARLAAREQDAPTEAIDLMDETTTLALDIGGVVGWLERTRRHDP